MPYIDLQYIRNEGYEGSEERFNLLTESITDFIDMFCKNIFRALKKTLDIDGCDGCMLPAPYSIIRIDSVSIYDGSKFNSVDNSSYVYYKGNDPSVDMFPRICLRDPQRIFPFGYQNIKVNGIWGCCNIEDNPEFNSSLPENDQTNSRYIYTTPDLIKKACAKLFFLLEPKLNDWQPNFDVKMIPYIIKERTDGHSYELSDKIVDSLGGLTGDKHIDYILEMYSRYNTVTIV